MKYTNLLVLRRFRVAHACLLVDVLKQLLLQERRSGTWERPVILDVAVSRVNPEMTNRNKGSRANSAWLVSSGNWGKFRNSAEIWSENRVFGRPKIVYNSIFWLSNLTFETGNGTGMAENPPYLILRSGGPNPGGFPGVNGFPPGDPPGDSREDPRYQPR